jgi:hypothetical protein
MDQFSQGGDPVSSPVISEHGDVVKVVMLQSVDQLQQGTTYTLRTAFAEELAARGAARIIKPPAGPKEFKDEQKPTPTPRKRS